MEMEGTYLPPICTTFSSSCAKETKFLWYEQRCFHQATWIVNIHIAIDIVVADIQLLGLQICNSSIVVNLQ